MIDATSESFVLLWNERYGGYSFNLCRFSVVFGKYIRYFGLLKLSSLWADSVWCGVYHCCIETRKLIAAVRYIDAP